jgi:monoamine oxidase
MAKKLPKGKLLQNKRVTKIAPILEQDAKEAHAMRVSVEGETTERHYDHVISTIPLGALRLVDLDDCELSYQLRESIRALQYGASVKIGIRFTHRWWEEGKYPHKGGVSTTDRCVV